MSNVKLEVTRKQELDFSKAILATMRKRFGKSVEPREMDGPVKWRIATD